MPRRAPDHRWPATTRPRAVALAVLLALGACTRPPTLTPLPDDAVVVAFGDSLTYGTGAPPEASYPSHLARSTGLRVVNAGVPGELSAEGRRRLPEVLAAHRPDLVLLCHGGNDLLADLPTDALASNLRAMIELAWAHGAEVVLIGVPRPALLLGTDPVYAEVADRLDVPLDDEALARILSRRSLKSDHIHPNADGYAALAEAVRELLVDAGALR